MEPLWIAVALLALALGAAVALAVRVARLRRELAARDERLAAAAHELRGPLQPIALAVSRLKRDEGLAQRSRDAAEIIERNLHAEARLVEDLFEATRGDRPIPVRPEPCDLNAVLEEIVDSVRERAAEKHLTIELVPDATGPFVLADPVRLRQIVRNLVDNAIRFTPAGGCVTVRSERGEGRHAGFEVRDTGPGIPPADRQRIFEPYAQLDAGRGAGGLGLGLYLVRKLAVAQSGCVSVTSPGPGQGTSFSVSLPRAAVPAAGVPARPGATAKKRILLAEDHEDSARLIGDLLASRGFSVTTVASVEAGLAQARTAPFDLLISDLELPDGSGLDLMRRLRSAGLDRGIAISGRATAADLDESRAAGFSAHLLKPIDFDELVRSIEGP